MVEAEFPKKLFCMNYYCQQIAKITERFRGRKLFF
jgi:hypothetical protein